MYQAEDAPSWTSAAAESSDEDDVLIPGGSIYARQPSVVPPPSAAPSISPPTVEDLNLPRPSTGPGGIELMSVIKGFEKETEVNPNYKDKTAPGVSIRTRYLVDEQERRPYEVGVGEGGKLYQAGSLLETGSETATAAFRSKGSAGGHLFAMSPTGQIYAADQAAQWEKGGMQGPSATVRKQSGTFVPADPTAQSAEAFPFHHSSFLAGGDVAGAGEMKVHEGLLSMISNASGHYRPGSKQVMQTLKQLQGSGAQIDQARVHLMGDYSTQAGYDASKEVTAAVGEYMAAEGSRAELLKRHAVLGELRREFGGKDDQGEDIVPEGDEMKEAHQEVFSSLGRRNPFNRTFRDAKRREAAGPQIEGQTPLRYSAFMKRATGRDVGPKPKEAFSFAMPAPSIAPTAAPVPQPQAFSASDPSPAVTLYNVESSSPYSESETVSMSDSGGYESKVDEDIF
jgi:hypothetical protein